MNKGFSTFETITIDNQVGWEYSCNSNKYQLINQRNQVINEWRKGDKIRIRAFVSIKTLGRKYDELLGKGLISLDLILTWHSSTIMGGSSLRGIIKKEKINKNYDEEMICEGEIDGDLIGRQLFVILSIVVSEDCKNLCLNKGIVLWNTEQSLLLEGEKSQFPMEFVSFRELKVKQKDSLFRLLRFNLSLDESFVNSYLLQVNLDNYISSIINSEIINNYEVESIIQLLSLSIYRGIMEDASKFITELSDYYSKGYAYPESLASVYMSLINTFYPETEGKASRVVKTLEQIRDRESDLDLRIQSKIFNKRGNI